MITSRNRNKRGIFPWLVVGLLFTGGGVSLLAKEESVYKSLDILCDVISIIQRDYIEKISSEKLTKGSLKGMLRSLDGYSYYIPAGEGEKAPEKPEAEQLGSYGLDVAYQDHVLTVVAPVEGGPAWKAGLKPDDKIIKINEKPVGESPLHDLYALFRGPVAEKVQLKVVRRGARDFLDFTLEPGAIEGPEARGEIKEETIGLLRISRFDEGTEERARRAMENLVKKGADSLIIDLRDCPGGEIDVAVAVANYFVPRGELITSMKGRIEGMNGEFRSRGDLLLDAGKPIVVLVNGGTSGAAEVLSAALRNSRKAVLMGQKTFGSAYREGSFALSDGSTIKLVTGIYLTPAGEEIQGKGLDVDIPVERAPEEQENGGKEPPEEKPEKKDEPGEKDTMLQGAIDLIKGIRIMDAARKEAE